MRTLFLGLEFVAFALACGLAGGLVIGSVAILVVATCDRFTRKHHPDHPTEVRPQVPNRTGQAIPPEQALRSG